MAVTIVHKDECVHGVCLGKGSEDAKETWVCICDCHTWADLNDLDIRILGLTISQIRTAVGFAKKHGWKP